MLKNVKCVGSFKCNFNASSLFCRVSPGTLSYLVDFASPVRENVGGQQALDPELVMGMTLAYLGSKETTYKYVDRNILREHY